MLFVERGVGRLRKCRRLGHIVQRVEMVCGCYGRFRADADAQCLACVHSCLSKLFSPFVIASMFLLLCLELGILGYVYVECHPASRPCRKIAAVVLTIIAFLATLLLHTEHSKDMIGSQNLKMRHVILITSLSGVVSHPKANTWYSPSVYKISLLLTKVVQEISLGPQNLNWVMWPSPCPCQGCCFICVLGYATMTYLPNLQSISTGYGYERWCTV